MTLRIGERRLAAWLDAIERSSGPSRAAGMGLALAITADPAPRLANELLMAGLVQMTETHSGESPVLVVSGAGTLLRAGCAELFAPPDGERGGDFACTVLLEIIGGGYGTRLVERLPASHSELVGAGFLPAYLDRILPRLQQTGLVEGILAPGGGNEPVLSLHPDLARFLALPETEARRDLLEYLKDSGDRTSLLQVARAGALELKGSTAPRLFEGPAGRRLLVRDRAGCYIDPAVAGWVAAFNAVMLVAEERVSPATIGRPMGVALLALLANAAPEGVAPAEVAAVVSADVSARLAGRRWLTNGGSTDDPRVFPGGVLGHAAAGLRAAIDRWEHNAAAERLVAPAARAEARAGSTLVAHGTADLGAPSVGRQADGGQAVDQRGKARPPARAAPTTAPRLVVTPTVGPVPSHPGLDVRASAWTPAEPGTLAAGLRDVALAVARMPPGIDPIAGSPPVLVEAVDAVRALLGPASFGERVRAVLDAVARTPPASPARTLRSTGCSGGAPGTPGWSCGACAPSGWSTRRNSALPFRRSTPSRRGNGLRRPPRCGASVRCSASIRGCSSRTWSSWACVAGCWHSTF